MIKERTTKHASLCKRVYVLPPSTNFRHIDTSLSSLAPNHDNPDSLRNKQEVSYWPLVSKVSCGVLHKKVTTLSNGFYSRIELCYDCLF